MTLNKKIQIPAGDTRLVRVRVVDDATGEPIDLDGAVITWSLARARSDAAPLASKQSGQGIDLDTSGPGRFSFRIQSSDSERPPGDYFHQARAVFPDGSITTLFAQFITIVDVV